MMRYRLPLSIFALLVFALLHVAAMAQGVSVPSAANNPTPSAKLAPVPLKIAPGDLLEVSVFDAPELNQQVRVGSDGKIELDLIGNTQVEGLTGQQAAEKIAHELSDRKFLVRPQVNVLIKEFASQGVSVMGEVQHPGIYQVLGPRTVLDVISMAGGLTNVADTRVTIKRRDGGSENVTVKLKTDDVQTSINNDLQVYPGDLVMVARAGIVYVLGDVNKPGGFVMQDNGHITLLQALAQAGGTGQGAAVNHAVLLHKNGDAYVTTKLQLAKVSRGQAHDIPLSANDIVFVPNSRLKSAMQQTESLASSIGSASIYAVVH
jgi:polysaccharide export outer membrane protein